MLKPMRSSQQCPESSSAKASSFVVYLDIFRRLHQHLQSLINPWPLISRAKNSPLPLPLLPCQRKSPTSGSRHDLITREGRKHDVSSALATIMGEPMHREVFQKGKLVPQLSENCWPLAARFDGNMSEGKRAKAIPWADNQLGELVRGNMGASEAEACKSMQRIRRTEALDEWGRMIKSKTQR